MALSFSMCECMRTCAHVYDPLSGRSTCALTLCNAKGDCIMPSQALVSIDRSYLPYEDTAIVDDRVKSSKDLTRSEFAAAATINRY